MSALKKWRKKFGRSGSFKKRRDDSCASSKCHRILVSCATYQLLQYFFAIGTFFFISNEFINVLNVQAYEKSKTPVFVQRLQRKK